MYSRTGSTDWKIQLPASATAHQHRWIVDQPAVTEKCHGIPCNDMTVIIRGFEIEGSGINWNIRTLLSGDKTHTHTDIHAQSFNSIFGLGTFFTAESICRPGIRMKFPVCRYGQIMPSRRQVHQHFSSIPCLSSLMKAKSTVI